MAVYNEATFDVKQFTGLDLRPNDEVVEDTTLVECVNMFIGDNGSLTKRQGWTPSFYPNMSTPTTPIGTFDIDLSSIHYVIASDTAGHTYYMNMAGLPTEIKFTNTAGTGSNSYQATSCVQLDNTLYLTVKNTGVWKWTGSGVATYMAASPVIDGIITYQGRLFGFSPITTVGVTNRSRIWYTGVVALSGDAWGSNFQDVQPGDGDFIQCLLPYKDRIVVFKTNSIWQLFVTSDPITWLLKLFRSGLGTLSIFGAEIYKNNYYFVHSTGVYACDGVNITELSVNIRTLFNSDLQVVSGCVSVIRSQLLVGSLPGIYDLLVYKLDSAIQGWTTVRTGFSHYVTNIVVGRDPVYGAISNIFAYAGSSTGLWKVNYKTTGATYIDFDGTGNKANVYCNVTSKAYNMGKVSKLKRNKYTYLFASGDNADVFIVYSQNAPGEAPGEKVLVTDTQDIYRISGAGYFRDLQITLLEASDKPFSIYGYSFVLMLERQVPTSAVG